MGKVVHPATFPVLPDFTKVYRCDSCDSTDSCFVEPSEPFILRDLMAIYWRIRSWQIDCTFTADCTPDTIQSSYIFSSTATREEDLVCGHSLFLESPTYPSNSVAFNFCVDPCKAFPLKLNLYIGGAEDCYTAEGSVNTSTPGRTIPYPDVSSPDITNTETTLTFYQSVKAKFYVIGGGQFGAGLSVDSISPILWWSYGGTYDVETGARLT